VHNNFSAVFTRFRDIAAYVLQNATFPTPPIVSPKFPHVFLGLGGSPFGYNGLIVRAISLQDFQSMWSPSTNVRLRDGRLAIVRPRFALKCIAWSSRPISFSKSILSRFSFYPKWSRLYWLQLWQSGLLPYMQVLRFGCCNFLSGLDFGRCRGLVTTKRFCWPWYSYSIFHYFAIAKYF